MITGHITNIDTRQYPPVIGQAIAYLASHDLTSIPSGRYQHKDTGWMIQVLDLHTTLHEDNYPEAHRHHIDVQYLVAGEEIIGVITQPTELAVHQPYDAKRDIIFYERAPDETLLRMLPGTFAIFFPQDIHRPNGLVGQPGPIRKVVVKIPISDLV